MILGVEGRAQHKRTLALFALEARIRPAVLVDNIRVKRLDRDALGPVVRQNEVDEALQANGRVVQLVLAAVLDPGRERHAIARLGQVRVRVALGTEVESGVGDAVLEQIGPGNFQAVGLVGIVVVAGDALDAPSATIHSVTVGDGGLVAGRGGQVVHVQRIADSAFLGESVTAQATQGTRRLSQVGQIGKR